MIWPLSYDCEPIFVTGLCACLTQVLSNEPCTWRKVQRGRGLIVGMIDIYTIYFAKFEFRVDN